MQSKTRSPTAIAGGLTLRSMLSADELNRRPSRAPDHEFENRALVALAQTLAATPDKILDKLAETALFACRAHSAGLSLLEDADQKRRFHWRAIAGEWSSHRGGGTPRDFGPCGTVLDRNAPLLCKHPELDFPYFADVTPLLEEALLVPFHVHGEAVGTIWVVIHDNSRRFDAEDLRLLSSLGTFAAAAYQARTNELATQQSAAIVDASEDAIVSENFNGIITGWNRGAVGIYGYTAAETIGNPIAMLIPDDRKDEEGEILQRIARGERIEHYETVRRHKGGRLIDVSLSVAPVRSSDGTIIGAAKFARDITERKQAEKHIELLAREVNHRAKNLLSIVHAVVSLTRAETPDELRAAIQGRLQAVGRAHNLLEETRWAGADIHGIVKEELAPYTQSEFVRAHFEGPRFSLEPDKAQLLAMVLHELTTNAVKYGALSTQTGVIQIQWNSTDGRLVLTWVEQGGPPVEPPTQHGFGTSVIERMIRQHKGDVLYDWRNDGLVCKVAIPHGPSLTPDQ